MAYYAELGHDNVVVRVIVVDDSIEDGEKWCASTFLGTWRKVNYSKSAPVKLKASLGSKYDAEVGGFVMPKPHASWTLDKETGQWDAPTKMPDFSEEFEYSWNEAQAKWDASDERYKERKKEKEKGPK